VTKIPSAFEGYTLIKVALGEKLMDKQAEYPFGLYMTGKTPKPDVDPEPSDQNDKPPKNKDTEDTGLMEGPKDTPSTTVDLGDIVTPEDMR
jgi:hypothetical protein